ncbi:MAG: O-antigen ligase family protein, partial [Planctomycetaceae bacterium]
LLLVIALVALLVGCVFLSGFPARKLIPLLGWGSAVAITAVTGSRIAALALLAAMIMHPLLGSMRRVAALAAATLVGIALFYSPTFQERFFPSGSGGLTDLASGRVEDAGRFDAWTQIWVEATNRPLLGAGVGSSHALVDVVWGDTDQVHNDYLRVFYETGLVGFALFLAVFGWQLAVLGRQIREAEGVLQRALLAAFLGLTAMLVTCLTDNTITYNLFYTDPLFAVIGSAAGVLWTERQLAANMAPDDALWRVNAFRQQAKLKQSPGQQSFGWGRGIILPNQ